MFLITIERGCRYREAGADAIFVEAPETVEEIRKVAKEIDAPLVFNIVKGGKTPPIPFDELADLGYRVGIAPGVLLTAAMDAYTRSLQRLASEGSLGDVTYSPIEVFKPFQLDVWEDIDARLNASTTT